jgi:hypothetical protein
VIEPSVFPNRERPVRSSKRFVWVVCISVGALAFVVCLLFLLFFNRLSSTVASAQQLESTYADLLKRIRQRAGKDRFSSSDLEAYEKPTSPSEILEAKIGRNNGYFIVGHKSLDFQSETFWFFGPATVGHPVIKQGSATLHDGSEIRLVVYEEKVLGEDGKEYEIIIKFDRDALEERLHKRKAE